MSGWIKLHKSIDKWEWRHKPITFSLFLYLLTNANYEISKYEGHQIPVGALVFGRKKAAKFLGVSQQNIRTALKHLKSTNEITIKTTNKFSIIQIVKWDMYQNLTNGLTINQPSTNQQLTTSKNKRNKEIKNNNIYRPENVSEEIWNDFLIHRKAKKAPVTKTVLNTIEKEATSIGWTLERALKEMCLRGWQGFRGEWINKQKGKKDDKQRIATETSELLDDIRSGRYS